MKPKIELDAIPRWSSIKPIFSTSGLAAYIVLVFTIANSEPTKAALTGPSGAEQASAIASLFLWGIIFLIAGSAVFFLAAPNMIRRFSTVDERLAALRGTEEEIAQATEPAERVYLIEDRRRWPARAIIVFFLLLSVTSSALATLSLSQALMKIPQLSHHVQKTLQLPQPVGEYSPSGAPPAAEPAGEQSLPPPSQPGPS